MACWPQGQAAAGGSDIKIASGIAAGLEAELGATIVDQVELGIAAAPHQLMLALRLGPGPVHVAAHQARIDVEEGLAHGLGEGEVAREIALQIIVEDAADAARLAAVRDEEVLVGPALEAIVGIGRVAVAGRLQPAWNAAVSASIG